MPKSKAALVPIKKNVTNKKRGSINEITYYINPDKKKSKLRTKGNTNKVEQENAALELSKVKDFEDFGKHGIDPTVARQFFCNL